MERLIKKQEITHITLLYGSAILCWIYASWAGYQSPDSWVQTISPFIPAWLAEYIIGLIPTFIAVLIGGVIGVVLCIGLDKLFFNQMISLQRDLDFEREYRPGLQLLDDLAGVDRTKDW